MGCTKTIWGNRLGGRITMRRISRGLQKPKSWSVELPVKGGNPGLDFCAQERAEPLYPIRYTCTWMVICPSPVSQGLQLDIGRDVLLPEFALS